MCIFSNYFFAENYCVGFLKKSKTETLLFTDLQQNVFYLTPKMFLGTQNYFKKFLALMLTSRVYQQ